MWYAFQQSGNIIDPGLIHFRIDGSKVFSDRSGTQKIKHSMITRKIPPDTRRLGSARLKIVFRRTKIFSRKSVGGWTLECSVL